ncbi:cysteine--tRNA ligase [Neofamilia massiliensis]|uniref:cysteine--tRNA ligase n=1 Tax=Neofamilia massiliensis TaxID=1673724 RepID=UPI0006BB898B|nr:cysteine--tRNA ligase [Neofamilia massiliensis]
MKLYNSLTRKKEEFIPINENEVKMYNCGPTVYNYIHVGNARPLVVFDTLRRYFIYKGYDVKFVVNFTDIDDKIIQRANEEGISTTELSNKYIEAFMEDAKALNLYDYETINPRATEYIQKIIDFVQGLVDKGAAYEVNGDVYFNIEAAKNYGKLSKKNLEDLISGARVDVNDQKRSPADFVLWKAKKEGEPSWLSPWGEGRPGWHIECSVMAKTLLGETIDIHSGGVDLQFPHHENEIAQSETLHDKTFARYWLHNGFITVDEEKMSKSLGNFFTLKDVAEKYDLEVLRFFLLSAHYRQPLNFSDFVMGQMKNGLERMYNAKYRLEELLEKTTATDLSDADKDLIKALETRTTEFENAMDDDLNTADAITAVYNLVKDINTNLDESSNKNLVQRAYEELMKLTNVLGILKRAKEEITDEDILKLIDQRQEARRNKDYKKADEIRDELLEKGIQLEDTREGVKYRRV